MPHTTHTHTCNIIQSGGASNRPPACTGVSPRQVVEQRSTTAAVVFSATTFLFLEAERQQQPQVEMTDPATSTVPPFSLAPSYSAIGVTLDAIME